MNMLRLFVAGALLLPANSAFAQQPPKPGDDGKAVLVNDRHPWRKFYMFAKPAYEPDASGKAVAGVDEKDSIYTIFTEPPPQDWTETKTRGDWLLRPGREFRHGIRDNKLAAQIGVDATNAYLRGSDPGLPPVALICQRTDFHIKDRSKVRKLTLSLTYRGGFVAYLNGQEIARKNLPAGELAPTTPADAYPADAFFYRNSLTERRPRPLDPKDSRNNQWPMRERQSGPIDVPLTALRDGTNTLALELHRATYPEQCSRQPLPCATVGLSLLELKADAAPEALPEPAGPWALAGDIAQAVFERPTDDYLGCTMQAARNGQFSAQVILGWQDGDPIRNLRVSAGGLMGTYRKPNNVDVHYIDAKNVRVRYAVPNHLWDKGLDQLGAPIPALWREQAGLTGGTRFDVLLDKPPADAKELAVWVTVDVPKDAPAADYQGEFAIDFEGRDGNRARIESPWHVSVADWTLPDVKDYATLINLYQSPETLAAYYRVKPWSEEHWRLIDRSMKLLAEFGNIGLFIPLLAESQMGNPESMVPWLKQPDGSYKYDFTIFDRYLDTAMKHHDPGRLRFISMNVWGYESSNRTWKGPRDYDAFYGSRVTIVNPDGKRESMKLPQYGTPESGKLWRPLLLALRDRLKARKLDDKLLLGLAADRGPEQEVAAMFHDILPDAGWIAESHLLNPGYVYDSATKAKMPVRYNSIVYGADIPDPAAKRLFGWQHRPDVLVMNFNRSGSNVLLFGYPPPWSFRTWMESTIACGRNGNGRVGGDYWRIGAEILGEGERGWGVVGGSGGSLFGRYMHSHSDEAGLGRSCTDLFAPGPDSAVCTVRSENAREGIQEAEARVFIEKALLARGDSPPMSANLFARCRRLLDERTNVLRLYKMNGAEVARQGWQTRSRKLYELAGEVAASVGKKD